MTCDIKAKQNQGNSKTVASDESYQVWDTATVKRLRWRTVLFTTNFLNMPGEFWAVFLALAVKSVTSDWQGMSDVISVLRLARLMAASGFISIRNRLKSRGKGSWSVLWVSWTLSMLPSHSILPSILHVRPLPSGPSPPKSRLYGTFWDPGGQLGPVKS